jgi:hypothetical protein
MSPLAILIVLGIAAIVWFGFLCGRLAGRSRNSGESGGSDFFESDASHRDHDPGGHDSSDGGSDGGGGDGGGD